MLFLILISAFLLTCFVHAVRQRKYAKELKKQIEYEQEKREKKEVKMSRSTTT
jgi:anaerobic C4-dicarboxylate transporter